MAEPADGIWVIDGSGRTSYANERMAEILGIGRTDLLGRDSFEFVFPEDRAAAKGLFNRKSEGDSNTFTFRLRRQDGSAVHVCVQGTPMHDVRGRFSGIVGTFSVIDPPAA